MQLRPTRTVWLSLALCSACGTPTSSQSPISLADIVAGVTAQGDTTDEVPDTLQSDDAPDDATSEVPDTLQSDAAPDDATSEVPDTLQSDAAPNDATSEEPDTLQNDSEVDSEVPDTSQDDTTQPEDTAQAQDTAPEPQCSAAKACAFPDVCLAGSCGLPPPLPYSTRTAWDLKAIQPDFWPNKDEIAGNGAGGVSMNLVWAQWQPSNKAPPCAGSEIAWQGGCYIVPGGMDAEIAAWTAKGLRVTAIVYGPPPWARVPEPTCSPAGAGFEWFCAPTDHAAFGRFAGLLARLFDGQHGTGRIVDFVIHNEVNANVWFDVGCGNGKACDTNAWLDSYAADFNAAYDAIVAAQPEARVLVSLDHHFGSQYDKPASQPYPMLAGSTVLQGVDARVGSRKWRVAMHPYPPDLLVPTFSERDYADAGKITYGSLGSLAGWLRKTFPSKPWTHEIHLTESGINGLPPKSNPTSQAKALCDALRAVLGTPDVANHIYHRMLDHPFEAKDGLGLGLWAKVGEPRPAWSTWALCNRKELAPSTLDCGFEKLPYVHLQRGYNASKGHWATTRNLPAGYTVESQSWKLLREPQPGTILLYSCLVGGHTLVTTDVGCEGQGLLGPLGWAFTTKPAGGGVPIVRCRIGQGSDHFVSQDLGCEGKVVESVLGYGVP